jgi:glycosyltransferase involved in cell wall biosynthesis
MVSQAGRMASPGVNAAVLFRRFGPYHHARLNAAGRLMKVVGIEACGMDRTYAWNKVEGAHAFARVTLTDRQTENWQWKRKLQQEMYRALGEAKPGVVVIPGWSSAEAWSALAWCVKTRTPAAVMSESTEWDEKRSRWKEALKQKVVSLYSAGLAGGTPHAEYLHSLGMRRENIFLGYDAVDNVYFAEGAAQIGHRKSNFRAEYGLPEKYFLASARFIEKKNLPRLVQAFARYRELAVESYPRIPTSDLWHLVILGDGPLKAELCGLIAELGLDTVVHLPGFKQYNELPMYYGLASVFVHASTTEQWGLVVNEAMASGLPVLVSSCCGCARDLVKDDQNGFSFDPHNIEQLAQLMLNVSTFQPLKLSAFGAASREIISHWGPERFADGLKRAVECALSIGPVDATCLQKLLLKGMLLI